MDVHLLKLEDVAKYLHVHPSTMYRLLKKSQLPAFKLGREWRFNRESIDGWRADAEQNVSTGGQRIPLDITDTNSRRTTSRWASSLPGHPANRQESPSKAGQLAWSGWPRLTDP
jgi:excisionase family DNA binding protein